MAWVGRLHFSNQDHRWLHNAFYSALGQICQFSTKERCWHVSSHGRLRDSRGRLTFGSLHPMGYRIANIFGERFLVHRVVAFVFLGPPAEASAWQVHHKDRDPLNNRLDNLAYVTPAVNIQSSFDNNASRGSARTALSKPVTWRNLATSLVWRENPSITAAAEELGVSKSTIAKYCRRGVPMGDYQLKFSPAGEPDCWPGEEWLPMKNPSTGHAILGRQVSSFGRIKSRNGFITPGHQARSGYFGVDLFEGSQRYSARVHRLVAYAFLGPPPSHSHTQINHKDLNPGNNRLENLEYVTPSENSRHFHTTFGHGQNNPRGSVPVLSRPYGSQDKWVKHPSIIDASKVLGIDNCLISRCARGLIKRAGTHEFRKAEASQPEHFLGEEWRAVDFNALLKEKTSREA